MVNRFHIQKKRILGFTLLEVLVAITVFASLSLAGYQVLSQVQKSNSQSLKKTARLKEIQRAISILDTDFRQISERLYRREGEKKPKAIFYYGEKDTVMLDSDDQFILFTRLGWQNPLFKFPRGQIIKVGYRIKANKLERVWWRYPDVPLVQDRKLVDPVLEQVSAMKFFFYKHGKWVKNWKKNDTLPAGIMIRLTLEDYGEIERVYLTTAKDKKKKRKSGNSERGGRSE